ncbi:hypothetical protein GCM10009804_03300 [Kribbella hippodromi]|uniref:Uncharacterized protein n=1 Tax=Kribbella hippodromi TaxID=434347 RepID=A0ABP4MTP7_9ACTN
MRIFASIIAAVLLLAGCGNNQEAGVPAPTTTVTATVTATPAAPDLDACRDAMRGDYETGWEKPAGSNDPYPPSARTAVCDGIDRPTLKRLMDEAVEDIMNGTTGP